MAKFHINSTSGEPGECRALVACPFASDDQHFPSVQEARAAYEEQMKEYERYRKSPLGRLDALTNKAIQGVRAGLDKAVHWANQNPKKVYVGVGIIGTVVVGLVAYRIANRIQAPPSASFSNGGDSSSTKELASAGSELYEGMNSSDAAVAPGVAAASGSGGQIGDEAGLGTRFIANLGVDRMSDWLQSGWNLRHEERFGLVDYQTTI